MAEPDEHAFYFWWIIDERTGKRRRTSWRMTPDTAREQHHGAEPDLSSREVRHSIGNAGDIGKKSALSE